MTLPMAGLLVLASCRKSSFDDAFDPRLLKVKSVFSAWSFDDAAEYDYDPKLIEVRDGSAFLKTVALEQTGEDLAHGTGVGTEVIDGLLRLDLATAGDNELDGAWVPQSEHLSAYWKFNGDATLSRGAGTVTTVGTPTFSSNRVLGSHAVKMSGATYYSIPRQKNYEKLTAVAWFWVDSWITGTAPIFYRINGQTWYPRLRVLSTGAVHFQYRLGGGTIGNVSADGLVRAKSWNHIAATLDPAVGSKIYVNGRLVATHTGTGTSISGGTNPMLMGFDDGTHYLDGRMDEAALWDSVLEESEIRLIYERQLGRFTGRFESPVVDLGAAGPWTGFEPRTTFPFGKELTAGGAIESAAGYAGLEPGLQQSLAGLWPLNEAAWAGAAGEVSDISGQGNHGTAMGGATTTRDGKFRGAGLFDPVSAQYVLVDVPLVSLTPISETATAWFSPRGTTPGSKQGIFSRIGTSNSNPQFAIEVNKDGTAVTCTGSYQLAAAINLENPLTSVPEGLWSHVACRATYEPSTTTMTLELFINGKRINAVSSTAVTRYAYTSSALHIGAQKIGGGAVGNRYFNGAIDEVGYWTRPLTDAEILQLYRRGANRVLYQVRSCAQANCAEAGWKGPDGTPASYFSEAHNHASIAADGTGAGSVLAAPLSLPFGAFATAGLSVSPNRYFQYRVLLASDDRDQACGGATCSPEVSGAALTPVDRFYGGGPVISPKTSLAYGAIQNLNADTDGCSPRLQLSRDGVVYRFWNGSEWADVTAAEIAQSSAVSDVQANLADFNAAGAGRLHARIFLPSDTNSGCELRSVDLKASE